MDKNEMKIEMLTLKAELKIERAKSEWLDRLADELRDGSDDAESQALYEEYKAVKKKNREELKNEYGVEL